MRRNYQLELDDIIARQQGAKPSLLLHSCCGPCSSSVLEYLTQFFEVTLLWYNPNIWPQDEFDRRLDAQQKLIRAMGLEDRVRVMTLPRLSEAWYDAVRGLEREPEGGARCTECFRLRLREAAGIAADNGFEYFCSTLTLSRHKDPVRINALGEAFAAEYGVPVVPTFVEMVDLPEIVAPGFHDVKLILHVLPPIFPDPEKSARENSFIMCRADFEAKVRCYEQCYGRPLTYEFSKEDIAGLI